MKRESMISGQMEDVPKGYDQIKLKEYVWASMRKFDEIATKLAACSLLRLMFSDKPNIVDLMRKGKMRFNKKFRTCMLFHTLPKYDARWRNHGAKQIYRESTCFNQTPALLFDMSNLITKTFCISEIERSDLFTMYGGDVKEYQNYLIESIEEENIRGEIDHNIQSWPKSAHGLKW
jgi:hypothetical protein